MHGGSGSASSGFARDFTNQMVTARYQGGCWTETELVPLAPLSLSPGAMVFHYGQAIFEGLKAFAQPGGAVALFRPGDHARRFNQSARRLAMPELPADVFTSACEALVRAEIDSVPTRPGHSLYLRPMLIATEASLGVRPSSEYLFVVIASAVGPYFAASAPTITVWATPDYSRAAPGGSGSAKCAGNYAASLAGKVEGAARGCDETLWLDAVEHRWIEELGGMNVIFVGAGRSRPVLVAPPVGDTVLDGVTRRSLLDLALHVGCEVVERPVSLDEVCGAGGFAEALACGTAVGVAAIGCVRTPSGEHVIGHGEPGPVTLRLRDALLELQQGRAPDPFGWRATVSGPVKDLCGQARTGARARYRLPQLR